MILTGRSLRISEFVRIMFELNVQGTWHASMGQDGCCDPVDRSSQLSLGGGEARGFCYDLHKGAGGEHPIFHVHMDAILWRGEIHSWDLGCSWGFESHPGFLVWDHEWWIFACGWWISSQTRWLGDQEVMLKVPWGESRLLGTCGVKSCVNVAGLWCPDVWSNTNLDVAAKAFFRDDLPVNG